MRTISLQKLLERGGYQFTGNIDEDETNAIEVLVKESENYHLTSVLSNLRLKVAKSIALQMVATHKCQGVYEPILFNLIGELCTH